MVPWWQDPAVEASLAVAYVDMIFLLLGIYGCEYFKSFGVEYAVIRRRLPFRWPLVPYLLGRLFLLAYLVLLAIETMPALSGIYACQPGITSIAILGGIIMGTSSTNLMIRTWVIWKNSRVVHLLLSLLALGHWAILALGTNTTNFNAYRSDGVCVVLLTHPAMNAGVLLYTMCYDLLVLILSIVKLTREPSKSPLKERLRVQGLLYFAVATVAYILPMVFAFLGSDGMINVTGILGIVVSAIASCRAVRSLLGLRTPHPSHAPLGDSVEDNAVLTTHISMGTF